MSTLLKIEFDIPEDKADEAGVFIASRTPHGWEEKAVGDSRHFTLYLEDHPPGHGDGGANSRRISPDGNVCHGEQESENRAMAWKDFFKPGQLRGDVPHPSSVAGG